MRWSKIGFGKKQTKKKQQQQNTLNFAPLPLLSLPQMLPLLPSNCPELIAMRIFFLSEVYLMDKWMPFCQKS